MQTLQSNLIIRPAAVEDRADLARLAALDSADVPAYPLLVAEVQGRLQAAVSIRDGEAIADPFVPTDHLVRFLRSRISRVQGGPRRPGRSRRRGRGADRVHPGAAEIIPPRYWIRPVA